MRTFMAIVVVALLAIVGMMADRHMPPRVGDPGRLRPLAMPAPAARPTLAAAPNASAPVAPQPPSAPSRRLQAALRQAADWRAFAIEAMQHPEQGGYFYAHHVLSLCARDQAAMAQLIDEGVHESISAQGTVTAARLDHIARFKAQCASFAAGESSEMFRAVRERLRDGRDPLATASLHLREAFGAHRPEALRAAALAVLRLDDPLLLSQAGGWALFGVARSSAAPSVFWFQGTAYPPGDETHPSPFHLALDMAVCRDDAPCASDDLMQMACVMRDACDADRHRFMKAEILAAGGTEAFWDEAVALEQRMREAIARHDLRAFFPPDH